MTYTKEEIREYLNNKIKEIKQIKTKTKPGYKMTKLKAEELTYKRLLKDIGEPIQHKIDYYRNIKGKQ